LSYLSQGKDSAVQVSRETLARHSGRSVRTVSRAISRLKILGLVEVSQPAPQGFNCWEPNVYRLSPLGRHLAALLGTGGNSPDLSGRDMNGPLFSEEPFSESSLEKTSETPVAHAENIEVFPEKPPAPDVPPELRSVVEELEQ